LNQSMTSQWPPKIVPIHTGHPVLMVKLPHFQRNDFKYVLFVALI
jgi:hypothetical protein